MRTKILLGFMGLLLVGAGLLFILPTRFAAGYLESVLAAELNNKTRGAALVDGELSWAWFPHFKLTATHLTLRESGQQLPVLAIRHLDLEMALTGLLRNEMHIQHLGLAGLTLNLIRDNQGEANWQRLVNSLKAEPPENGRASGNAWAIDTITVDGAAVFWRDQQTGQSLAFKDINWRISGLSPGKTFSHSLSAVFTGSYGPSPAKLLASGLGQVDSRFRHWQMMDVRIDLFGGLAKLAPDQLAVTFRTPRLWLDLPRVNLGMPEFFLQNTEINMQGQDLTCQAMTTQAICSALLQAESFNLKNATRQWGVILPELNNTEALSQVAFNLGFTADNKSLRIEKLKGKLDQTGVEGEALLSYQPALNLAFDLHADTITLDDYLPHTQALAPTVNLANKMINFPAPPAENWFELEINGTLHAERLSFKNIVANDVRLAVSSDRPANNPGIHR